MQGGLLGNLEVKIDEFLSMLNDKPACPKTVVIESVEKGNY
jgi:hypothetical protein